MSLAINARLLRASMLDVAGQRHVTWARLRGLSDKQTERRHILRNASLPMITAVWMHIGELIGGTKTGANGGSGVAVLKGSKHPAEAMEFLDFGWNNAGPGHSALMELNYTPQNADGSISIEKAVAINEAFQISRQFWAHQVERGVLRTPRSFINTVPHMSFVWGEDNVNFLRARYAALQQSSLFRGMRYSEDHAQIKEWAPLVMEGRDPQQKVAATRTEIGTDVNYGEITRQLIASLQKKSNFSLQLSSEVRALKRNDDNSWTVTVADLKNGTAQNIRAKFVFIGAGGAALKLLQESGIPEAKDYAGFPVGGQFLVSENPDVVNHHLAKVYGKASVGAPPMSVPHIDTRVLDGKRVVLFGPFATFGQARLDKFAVKLR